MDVAITRMSTKGQIVIPNDLRSEFEVGEKLLVIRNEDQLIIKKATKLDESLKEDLEFAKRTEAAWKRYEKGEFTEMSADDFLKKMKSW
ncbi:AbrB/MazE/SpoVT family DNA-binding domain-containing protein [Candidatus Woesearchaeota archaeon]|nr:AbrB/MazE/SpoVT family DNA-binding domain-containing protein [Candidatus Woesearchaeota archaeon]